MLLGLGAVAVLLHQALRSPLHLPGRQGLVWMALLVVGRQRSGMPLAATTAGLGAGTFALASFLDPLTGFLYAFTGAALDWAWARWPVLQRSLWAVGLACGLLHALKPLLRYAMAFPAAAPHASLAVGLLYPLTTHFLFGAAGALGALLLLKGVAHTRRP
ncbi:MAG: hypothetical protein AB1505_17315 [Candidatus Latescibacterota bacterium]